ncbi:MAG: hypothetical protein ACK40A_15890, partial [Pannonibacter indicus]
MGHLVLGKSRHPRGQKKTGRKKAAPVSRDGQFSSHRLSLPSGGEHQQLDGREVLHAAADALGRVEEH